MKASPPLSLRRSQLSTVPESWTCADLLPHAAQALRISRWRRETNRQPSRETVYAITDLTATQAGAAQLADLARTHWHVEVRHEVALSELANRTGGPDIGS
jgi:hypothetical protein